jgi:hypothetical protein
MDIGIIFTEILKNGGPAMAVAVLFLFYLHKEGGKKDAEIKTGREDIKELIGMVISDKEKQLAADAEMRLLIERLMDKHGVTESVFRESLARMEDTQRQIMSQIQKLQLALNK